MIEEKREADRERDRGDRSWVSRSKGGGDDDEIERKNDEIGHGWWQRDRE